MANFSMVSADQIETFRRDGFLHIPGLVDEPAVALLRAAMDDLFGASDGDPGSTTSRHMLRRPKPVAPPCWPIATGRRRAGS